MRITHVPIAESPPNDNCPASTTSKFPMHPRFGGWESSVVTSGRGLLGGAFQQKLPKK